MKQIAHFFLGRWGSDFKQHWDWVEKKALLIKKRISLLVWRNLIISWKKASFNKLGTNLLSKSYALILRLTNSATEAATGGVLNKRCFSKFCKIHKKTPVRSQPATLLKKRLWRSCFPVSFAKFLRTPFL